MIFSDIYWSIHQFVTSYPIIAAIIGVVLIVFLWQKPWEFFRIFVLVLILVAAGYYFALLTSSADLGSEHKRAITTEREEQLEEK